MLLKDDEKIEVPKDWSAQFDKKKPIVFELHPSQFGYNAAVKKMQPPRGGCIVSCKMSGASALAQRLGGALPLCDVVRNHARARAAMPFKCENIHFSECLE